MIYFFVYIFIDIFSSSILISSKSFMHFRCDTLCPEFDGIYLDKYHAMSSIFCPKNVQKPPYTHKSVYDDGACDASDVTFDAVSGFGFSSFSTIANHGSRFCNSILFEKCKCRVRYFTMKGNTIFQMDIQTFSHIVMVHKVAMKMCDVCMQWWHTINAYSPRRCSYNCSYTLILSH